MTERSHDSHRPDRAVGKSRRLHALVAAVLCAGALLSVITTTTTPQRAFAAAPTPRSTPTRVISRAPARTPTAVAATQSTPVARPSVVATSTSVGQDGAGLYRTLGCGGCHTLATAGTTGVFGPSHNHIATEALNRIQAADYHGAATTAAQYLRESIVSPDVYQAPEFTRFKYAMPAFKNLAPADLDRLVAYLLLQR